METDRVEFGRRRVSCDCPDCRVPCRFMPGFLIASDLGRMIPAGVDPLAWAEANLRASPGAIIASSLTGERVRVPTLVPADRPDGSCINLRPDGHCGIHAASPFGCAFFGCGAAREQSLSLEGILSLIREAADPDSLYYLIWLHLLGLGLTTESADVKRARMAAAGRRR